jgi:CO/xanthine dehydrogenase FAD-binding subunit
MKCLPQFEYVVPQTINELSSFLRVHGTESKILAGGTDLLIKLKSGDLTPKYVVDITRLKELYGVRKQEGKIIIGATTTHTDIAESPIIRQEAEFLSEAAAIVGSTQIRNSGTLGGNIANASPAADTIPPLIALDAEVRLVSFKGERMLPLKEIYCSPYKTSLVPKEFIADIRFNSLSPQLGTCFLKLGRRKALAISRLSIAAALELGSDGRIKDARISPGAILPVPSRIKKAEEALYDFYPNDEIFQMAGVIVAEEMVMISGRRSSTPYKEPVIKNLVWRALTIALERCQKNESKTIFK